MYERKHEPKASRNTFARRMARHVLAGAGLSLFALLVGMAGYHWLEGLRQLLATSN